MTQKVMVIGLALAFGLLNGVAAFFHSRSHTEATAHIAGEEHE